MNTATFLEPAAHQVCIDSAKPPLIFQLPPAIGRAKLEQIQDLAIYQYPAQITRLTCDTGPWGMVNVYVVRPNPCPETPNTIFYIHGAGWVFGSFHTHEKLVRELAFRTGCVLIFPEYSLSPEAKYPTAIEQCYCVLCRLPSLCVKLGVPLKLDKLTVAGDSVGGNMAIAMALLSKQRQGPNIHKQLLYYPVTNSYFCTASYVAFAKDYYLYRAGMMWFWEQYIQHEAQRKEITASPMRASLNQLKCLPTTMIINGEADVLRDEGESFAKRLMQAGVDVTAVRIRATIHDFVMLNALNHTNACRAAMDLSTTWIDRKNKN